MSACLLCFARQLLSSAMQGIGRCGLGTPKGQKWEKRNTQKVGKPSQWLKYNLLPYLYDLLCDRMQWKKGKEVQEWSLENRWKHHEDFLAWCFPWRIKKAGVPFSINKSLHWFLNYRYWKEGFQHPAMTQYFPLIKPPVSPLFLPDKGHMETFQQVLTLILHFT